MTELLEQAISNIKTLPSDQQEAIASIILEEIQVNQEWNQFSLEQAMRDLENDNLPEYTETDLIALHMQSLRRRAERGETPGTEVNEKRIRLRFWWAPRNVNGG